MVWLLIGAVGALAAVADGLRVLVVPKAENGLEAEWVVGE